MGSNIQAYNSYPRLVGETGGKNAHLLHPSADMSNAIQQTIRGAFEYAGQKCSATSILYAPRSHWTQIREGLVREVSALSVGPGLADFVGPVINQAAFDKLSGFIERAKKAKDACEVIVSGICDDNQGYFIPPTILLAKQPDYETMREELFGPILTVYLYDDWQQVLQLAASTRYALTLGVFAQDRQALAEALKGLRHAAGNIYLNDKCTGAIVGQQAFGGARQSGTNDKAGSHLNLLRWLSPRLIKESFIPLNTWRYPSNQ